MNKPRGAFTCRSSALAVLADSGPFRGLLLTVFGSRGDFHDKRTPGCVYVSVISTRSFDRFWPVSWTITHRFGVPGCFPRFTNPGVRLRVGHQHSQFWPILARFVDYYSPFWGPGVISTINEPRGVFTSWSSALAVLADSGPFRGLFFTVLGSRLVSTINEPRGAFTCRSSALAVLADSGPFRGLLLTVLGSRSDFHD